MKVFFIVRISIPLFAHDSFIFSKTLNGVVAVASRSPSHLDNRVIRSRVIRSRVIRSRVIRSRVIRSRVIRKVKQN
jgi:hypothetical protein